jgi:hypothetical protein
MHKIKFDTLKYDFKKKIQELFNANLDELHKEFEFESKLTHLVYSVNKSHCFNDGNKRTSIALGAFFLEINGLDVLVTGLLTLGSLGRSPVCGGKSLIPTSFFNTTSITFKSSLVIGVGAIKNEDEPGAEPGAS